MIGLVLLMILFGFGWLNSLVSYKYEVQDTLFAKKPLDHYQQYIVNGITMCKIGLALSSLLLVTALVVNERRSA